MIEPGSASGTRFAFADGEAIGGRVGGMLSALSDFISTVGFGSRSTAPDRAAGVGEGVGDGDASFLSFSSSSSLPTNFEVVRPTSFRAANTDAPRLVIIVPPLDAHSFSVLIPPVPKFAK